MREDAHVDVSELCAVRYGNLKSGDGRGKNKKTLGRSEIML